MTRVKTKMAGRSVLDRLVYELVRDLLWLFLKVWCRMRIDGREHLPRHGAYVLAPTHRSIIDTPIGSALSRRRLRFMGADKWWTNRWFGRLLTALGGFPITRGTADREALKRSIAALSDGEPLVLFPEGERKAGPLVQPLFDGAAYVAVKAGVPIVPVGIGGSERVMPKGARFIRPHRVHIVIGEPIVVEPDGRTRRDQVRQVTDELHDGLQKLFDAAQVRAG